MDDLLTASAKAYLSLLNKRYRMIIARKRKLVEVVLVFPVEAYFHLAGLQYVGINQLANRKEALRLICDGGVTQEILIASGAFDKIVDRLQSICLLPTLLEHGQFVFKYRGHGPAWSDIKADYLVYFPLESDAVLYFVAGLSEQEQKPVSIFRRSDDDYTTFCPQYKVMQIIRESLGDNVSQVVYTSPSYKQ